MPGRSGCRGTGPASTGTGRASSAGAAAAQCADDLALAVPDGAVLAPGGAAVVAQDVLGGGELGAQVADGRGVCGVHVPTVGGPPRRGVRGCCEVAVGGHTPMNEALATGVPDT